MAQYCEIAKVTTNCTDNCYECLRGETKIRGIEIGDKVLYITEDSKTRVYLSVVRKFNEAEYEKYYIRKKKEKVEKVACL